jgi:hypothetical protein
MSPYRTSVRQIVNVPPRHAMSFSAVLAAAAFVLLSCSPATDAKVNTAVNEGLNIAQLACIMASDLSGIAEIAVACDIIKQGEKAAPWIEQYIESMIGQRESLKKAGYKFDKAKVRWEPPPAGSPAPCAGK